MTDVSFRRGPDSRGVWIDEAHGVALGHRRLAILDLTADGAQPMVSHSGKSVIVFNGEIYNHKELRAQLVAKGHVFRGHSDTEVLLEAIEHWGFEEALVKSRGMFALAVWDRVSESLYLARDRFGEKPLYYGQINGAFLFGSELKILKEYSRWSAEIDRNAILLYLRHRAVPHPYTIYEGVWKLGPGEYVVVWDNGASVRKGRYWSAAEAIERGLANPLEISEEEAEEELNQLLREVIAMQHAADVPVGAFLSGGIDSALIVGIMQAMEIGPVKTFTIGFSELEYNESPFARQVAEELGTEHHEWIVTPRDVMDVIPDLPTFYDEPFADSSQLPTVLVAKFARQHVTVALTGDGGDEIFGGYQRYVSVARMWKSLNRLGGLGRHLLRGTCLGLVTMSELVCGMQRNGFGSLPGKRKLLKLGEMLDSCSSREVFYDNFMSSVKRPQLYVRDAKRTRGAGGESRCAAGRMGFSEYMMRSDVMSYLPIDILAKVDRAAMAISLETRAPLLDHHIFEFAWRLPRKHLLRGNDGKLILRRVAGRYVNSKHLWRQKHGFTVPVGQWLRGPLRPWAEELLNSQRLEQEGFFNVARVRTLWARHLEGKCQTDDAVWAILMFQQWLAVA